MRIPTAIPARIALATAAAAVVAGSAAGAVALGTGAAQAMPTDHDVTTAIVVHNDTDSTMFLDAADKYYGDWLQAPGPQIAPHSAATISAQAMPGLDRLGVRLDYHLSGTSMSPRGTAALQVENSDAGIDFGGTYSDGDFSVVPSIQAGHPHSTVVFDVL